MKTITATELDDMAAHVERELSRPEISADLEKLIVEIQQARPGLDSGQAA